MLISSTRYQVLELERRNSDRSSVRPVLAVLSHKPQTPRSLVMLVLGHSGSGVSSTLHALRARLGVPRLAPVVFKDNEAVASAVKSARDCFPMVGFNDITNSIFYSVKPKKYEKNYSAGVFGSWAQGPSPIPCPIPPRRPRGRPRASSSLPQAPRTAPGPQGRPWQ